MSAPSPSPTAEQLQQAEAMLRAGHHPSSVQAATRLSAERVKEIAARLRKSSTPRPRR